MLRIIAALLLMMSAAVPALADTNTSAPAPQTAAEVETVGEPTVKGFWG